MDRSPPGSSDHEIFQARIPEWVATWGEFSSPRDGIPTQGLNLPLLHLLYYGQVDSLAPPAAAAKSLHLCPTLCSPMDCSPSGSSDHGIVQARIQERLPCPPPKAPRHWYWGGYLSILIPSVVFNYFLPEGHPLTSASKIASSQLFQPPGFSSPWSLTGPFWHAPHPPRPLPLSAAHLHISHCVISPTSLVSLPTGFWWLPASSITSKFPNLNFPFEPQICVAN